MSGEQPRLENSHVWRTATAGEQPRLENSHVWRTATSGEQPRLENSHWRTSAAAGTWLFSVPNGNRPENLALGNHHVDLTAYFSKVRL